MHAYRVSDACASRQVLHAAPRQSFTVAHAVSVAQMSINNVRKDFCITMRVCPAHSNRALFEAVSLFTSCAILSKSIARKQQTKLAWQSRKLLLELMLTQNQLCPSQGHR